MMTTVKLDIQLVEDFITNQEIDAIQHEITVAQKQLLKKDGKGNDFLGWATLPSDINNDLLESIQNDAKEIKKIAQLYVVVGIGGSYLGARAVIESLQPEFGTLAKNKKDPYILYAGHTLSEEYYADLLSVLDSYDYALTVISKSGTTTESALAFRLLKNHIENKYGKEGSKKRIIAITDAHQGALHDIAQKEGYKTYVIPDNIGGRFSVLTPVGLLPIAVAGFDIEKLLSGAVLMQQHCIETDSVWKNPALLYAAIRNLLYRKGKKVEMLVSYLPNLKYMAEWWKQLYGESEGKDGKGILPHSAIFTTDLHSMGQYIQDGERLLFETVLSIETSKAHIDIPYDIENLDELNYLQKKTITQLNHFAEKGTSIAHHSGGIPIMRIAIPKLDETTLGELIYFFEYACAISGYVLQVNPFDQPGVEAYKKNMFALLGKKGYENYTIH